MSTNISFKNKDSLKTNLTVLCGLTMLAGFLFSRAMLSLSVIVLGFSVILLSGHPKKWFKDKWWLLGVVWIALYVISGLWSDNMYAWNGPVSVKLPILLLPLAFSFIPPLSDRQMQFFTILASIMFLITIGYSVSFLIIDGEYYIEQYRFSKVLPTLAQHDYIRYSLSLSLFAIWCICVWDRLTANWQKWYIGIIIGVLFVYIHIIAVKTGVLVIYSFFFLWGVYYAFSKRRLLGIGLIVLMVCTALGAYKYVLTFQNKVDYFRYTWKVFNEGNISSDYSDIGRLISYDVAIDKIKEHPLLGTGMGDMHDVMREGYKEKYPNVPANSRLRPHNQFMVVALGCGIPAMLLFLIWVIYPVKWVTRDRRGFFYFAVWLLMFIPLMVEPFLELQFGVYVYLFYLLWFRNNLKPVKKSETVNI